MGILTTQLTSMLGFGWPSIVKSCQIPKSLTWLDSIRTLPGVEGVPSFERRPCYKRISHALNVWSRVYSPTSIWVGYGVHVGIWYVYVHIYHTVQETIFKFSMLHILRYDGEIHSDDLPKALLHSGFEDNIVDSCNRLETSPRRGPTMIYIVFWTFLCGETTEDVWQSQWFPKYLERTFFIWTYPITLSTAHQKRIARSFFARLFCLLLDPFIYI